MNGEEEKAKAEEFAQDIGLTQDEFKELVAKATKEMEQRGITENEDYYIYKRVGFALKLKQRNKGKTAEGFFIAQQNFVDYARKPRETIDNFIESRGLQLATSLGICDNNKSPLPFFRDPNTHQPVVPSSIDEEDDLEKCNPLSADDLTDYIRTLGESAAKKNGMLNDEGEYIYSTPEWKKGKVIPEHEYGGTAYGLFTVAGEDDPKLSEVTLYGEVATKALPTFKIVEFPTSLNKNKSTPDFHKLSLNKPIEDVGDDVDYFAYDEIVRKAAPDRRLDSLDELGDFIDAHQGFNEWAVVDADITEVGSNVSQFDSIAVTVSNSSSLSITGGDEEVTFWAKTDIAKGLDVAGEAIVVVAPRRNNEGKISGNLIGYYIDPVFRPMKTNDLDGKSVLDTW